MLSIAPLLVGCAALTVLGCAALQDVRERLIANRFPLILLLLAPVHHALQATDLAAWSLQMGAALVVATALFLLGFLLWRVAGLGGGDVKLLVAASFFVGLGGVVPLLVGTVLAGGVLALASLAMTAMRPTVTALVDAPAPGAPTGARRSIPYGVAITTGAAWAILPSLPLMIG